MHKRLADLTTRMVGRLDTRRSSVATFDTNIGDRVNTGDERIDRVDVNVDAAGRDIHNRLVSVVVASTARFVTTGRRAEFGAPSS